MSFQAAQETIHRACPSPVGNLLLVASSLGLARVVFEGVGLPAPRPGESSVAAGSAGGEASRILDAAVAQLGEYFAGRRRRFDLPLDAAGTTFQGQVWNALGGIPFGTTTSYREIAARIGRPPAVRAVGMSCARNPLPIIVPCHRVVGADGSPTGYAGGIDRKVRLLRHEAEAARAPGP